MYSHYHISDVQHFIEKIKLIILNMFFKFFYFMRIVTRKKVEKYSAQTKSLEILRFSLHQYWIIYLYRYNYILK